MNKLACSISLIILLCCNLTFAGTYGGGAGTSGDPYQISTASHLSELYATSGDWNKYFIQTADITVSGGWTPIGNSTTNFSGSYNGQNHTISGVAINNSLENQGFFGKVTGATIQNLGLLGVSISTNGTTGGLAGVVSTSTISNCYTTGTLSIYYSYSGGLIGNCVNSAISDCYSTASITGGQSGNGGAIGGLIGTVESVQSSINNCYHITGDVYGREYTGGLIGANNYGEVNRCYSSGGVYGTLDVGGLIGYNSNNINDCYSRANASGSSHVGGLVGRNSENSISKCYSTGTAGATTNAGGLIGWNENGGTITNSFWDTQTSGQSSSAGGTGKTTTEMKTASTFTDAGWSSDVWNIDAGYNDGYPHLDWQNTGGTPLPVELVSFGGKFVNGSVHLRWQTATEVENYGFEIHRSTMNSESVKIGFVEASGNSNSPKNYSFTDKNVSSRKYFYKLKQIDTDGKFEYSNEIEVDLSSTSTEFVLHQNYPNPFNPSTVINYQIPTSSYVTLKVYDVLGNEVAVLVNEWKEAGNYNYELGIRNGAGAPQVYELPSGVYFYQLRAGNFSETKKCILLK